MRRIGIAMRKLDHIVRTAVTHESVIDFTACHHRTHRDDAIGQLLGGAHDVRGHGKRLGTKTRSTTAKPRYDFIKNQQNIMRATNFPQALQVAPGGNHHATRTRKRLDDYSGNGRCIVQADDGLKLIGQMRTIFRLAAAEGIFR